MNFTANIKLLQTYFHYSSRLSFSEAIATTKRELQQLSSISPITTATTSNEEKTTSANSNSWQERLIRALSDLAAFEREYFLLSFLRTPLQDPSASTFQQQQQQQQTIIPNVPLLRTAESLANEFTLLANQTRSNSASPVPLLDSPSISTSGTPTIQQHSQTTTTTTTSILPLHRQMTTPNPQSSQIASSSTASIGSLGNRRFSLSANRGRTVSGGEANLVNEAEQKQQQIELIRLALSEIAIIISVRADMMSVYRILAQHLLQTGSILQQQQQQSSQNQTVNTEDTTSIRSPKNLETLANRVGKHVVTLEKLKSPLLRNFLPHAQLEAGLLNHILCADQSITCQKVLPSALSLFTSREIASMWKEHYLELRSQPPLNSDQSPSPSNSPLLGNIPAIPTIPQINKQSVGNSKLNQKIIQQCWLENRVFGFLFVWLQHLMIKASVYFHNTPPPPSPSSPPPPQQANDIPIGMPFLNNQSPINQQNQPNIQHQIPFLTDHTNVNKRKQQQQEIQQQGNQQPNQIVSNPTTNTNADLETRIEDFVRKNGVLSVSLILNVTKGALRDPKGYTCRNLNVAGEEGEEEEEEIPITGMASWATMYDFPEGSTEFHKFAMVSVITKQVSSYTPEQHHIWIDSHMMISFMTVERGVYIVVVAKDSRKGIDKISKEFCTSICRFLRLSDAFSLLKPTD